MYECNFDWVYGYVFVRLSNNHHQTEDLVSGIWEIAYNSLNSLRSKNKRVFSTWLFKIVRSSLAKYFSKAKKMETLDLGDFEIVGNDDVTVNVHNDLLYVHCRKLINSLPDVQKETLFLRYMSEFSNKEIAQNLNVSEKTVSSNLSRALSFLRKNYTLTNKKHEL